MKTKTALAAIILLALGLSSLPYLIGWAVAPPGTRFMGLTYNIDDAYVYLSWTRQAADGHLFIRNQFATEPQHMLQFNVFFLILGWLSRLLHLPLIAAYHVARLLMGAMLLWMVYKFSGLFFKKDAHRLSLVAIVAFSSGIGWVFGKAAGQAFSVDRWQPEAITFLSLYLNPLFLCAQTLMLATLYFLLRCRSSGRTSHAALAGVCGLLLANIHTYDVVTVAAVWVAFRIASTILEREVNGRLLLQTLLAAVIASPALLYQLRLYQVEEVFRLRANTPTLSPAPWAFWGGYGIILILAVVGLPIACKLKRNALLPATWALLGFLLPYLNVSQQRKLVMGLHIPLAILAVYALVWLSDRRRVSMTLLTLLALLLTIPTNLWFLRRDIDWLLVNQTATQMHRPYLTDDELAGMKWLESHTRPTDSVLAFPDIACRLPALTGNRTYVGHWSETPDFGRKLREWAAFAGARASNSARQEFLVRSQTRYVWWDDALKELPPTVPGGEPTPAFHPSQAPYLHEEFHSGHVKIYRIVSTSSSGGQ